MPFVFDNRSAALPAPFFARVGPTPVRAPAWLAVNEALGAELGLGPDELRSPEMLAALAGNRLLPGMDPIALAYAGHQFGSFNPRLGDGRAILLGEVRHRDGKRRDVQLKGAGPTPFSRGGDGRAALGPVLREFLVSEAMAALGVPTTRALAAVRTGDFVFREGALPGAILTRVAASHIRVGTFAYFAARRDTEALRILMELAIERHHPIDADGEERPLAFFDAVLEAQARLVAQWMGLGFVHGVMNTDNCAISGETIDYGPCAFLDGFDPGRAFSFIDEGGRYAYANQPRILAWNLARLAEALVPVAGAATPALLQRFQDRLARFGAVFEAAQAAVWRQKLGWTGVDPEGLALAEDLLTRMAADAADFTLVFHQLTRRAEGRPDTLASLFPEKSGFASWLSAWDARFAADAGPRAARVAAMRAANPAVIPRNHRVEEAISSAVNGVMGPFERLRAARERPGEEPADASLMEPPGREQWNYVTFCGT